LVGLQHILYENSTLIEGIAKRNNGLQLTCEIVIPELQFYSISLYCISYVMSKDIEVKSLCSPNPVTEMSMTAADRLLGLRVRIPPGTYISVSCEYCLLSDRGLCVGLVTRPEESYRLWCLCDH